MNSLEVEDPIDDETLEKLVEERMDENEKEIVLEIEHEDEDSRVFRRHTNAGAGDETKVFSVTLNERGVGGEGEGEGEREREREGEGVKWGKNNGISLLRSLKRWIQGGLEMFDSVFMRVIAVLLCLALVVLLVLAIPRAVGVIEAGVQSILPPILPTEVASSTTPSPPSLPQMNLMSMMLPLVVSHFILPKLF